MPTSNEPDAKKASGAEKPERSQTRSDEPSLQATIDEIEQEFHKVKERVMGIGNRTSEQVRDQLVDTLDALKDELEKVSNQAVRQGRRTTAKAEEAIQERPVLFVIASFVLGMVMAQLFRR